MVGFSVLRQRRPGFKLSDSIRSRLIAVLCLALWPAAVLAQASNATSPSPVAASDAPPAQADSVEEIVIEARRSGAPMWQITKGDATVLLVGEITAVPKATPWRPDRLEAATRQSRQVILGVEGKFSPADFFRLLWRSRDLTQMPKGVTAADYLNPSQQGRLEALERRYRQTYQRQSLIFIANNLLNEQLKFNRNTTEDATDVVRRTARKAHIATRPVGRVYGDELVDSLLSAPQSAHVRCLDAAMKAAETGEPGVVERGDAWTRFDVPKVMASPLEIALGACWPWSDPRFGPELRGQWTDAVAEALETPGVTLAVAPLNVLAEKGGVLDQLEQRSLQVEGPAWKPRR